MVSAIRRGSRKFVCLLVNAAFFDIKRSQRGSKFVLRLALWRSISFVPSGLAKSLTAIDGVAMLVNDTVPTSQSSSFFSFSRSILSGINQSSFIV